MYQKMGSPFFLWPMTMCPSRRPSFRLRTLSSLDGLRLLIESILLFYSTAVVHWLLLVRGVQAVCLQVFAQSPGQFAPCNEACQGGSFPQQVLGAHKIHEPVPLHLVQVVTHLLEGIYQARYREMVADARDESSEDYLYLDATGRAVRSSP